ncbi:hypothetical protein JCM10213_006155 [Rhodosporidiobolus nylandii]
MVRFTPLVLLASASAALATPSPAPTTAPNPALSLLKRSSDWTPDLSTAGLNASEASDAIRANGARGFIDLWMLGKESYANNTKCKDGCEAFAMMNESCTATAECLCSRSSMSAAEQCGKCLGGNSTAQASDFVAMCKEIGADVSGLDSGAVGFFGAKGGFAAALLASGIAVLAL